MIDLAVADRLKADLTDRGWQPSSRAGDPLWWWCVVLSQALAPGTMLQIHQGALELVSHYGATPSARTNPCFHLGYNSTYKYFRSKTPPMLGTWSFDRITPTCATHGTKGLEFAFQCTTDCTYGLSISALSTGAAPSVEPPLNLGRKLTPQASLKSQSTAPNKRRTASGSGGNATREAAGRTGEAVVRAELERRGWSVRDLNEERTNEPNADLVATTAGRVVSLQVKAFNRYGWISGGSVNPAVCDGAPLFNRVKNAAYKCDFVICVTPGSPREEHALRDDWRFFVLPVDTADTLFRVNIDAYYNGLKTNGAARSKSGLLQDWVGPGIFRSRAVPDHKEDYLPFEEQFGLLEFTG